MTLSQPSLSTSSPPNQRSFFFSMVGTPFHSENTTSLFRLVEAALRQGHLVNVWNCGHATGLSKESLKRPHNFFERQGDPVYTPTSAEMIQAMKRQYGNCLHWMVCDYCMNERGNQQQIPESEVKIPFSYQYYLSAADVSLFLGVKS